MTPNDTIHILYGQSAAMTLSVFLKANNRTDEVYAVTDDLSIGPLDDMDERMLFLTEIFKSATDAHTDGIEPEKLSKMRVDTWQDMPDYSDKKIVIWHNDNVVEQVMLRMLAFRNQEYDMYQIHTNQPDRPATAFYMPYELGKFISADTKISKKNQKYYISDWERLKDGATLRVLQDNVIEIANENYYDKDILKTCSEGEQSVPRIIGAVIGKSKQFVADTFISYRIQQLINKKKLKYLGEPSKDMWERSVKVI